MKPQVKNNMTSGGIALPDEVINNDEIVSQVGQVIEVGPTAFSDKNLFPGGRQQYRAGDWVMFNPHTGSNVTVEEDGDRVKYRIMNDDHVLAKADDPANIKSTIL